MVAGKGRNGRQVQAILQPGHVQKGDLDLRQVRTTLPSRLTVIGDLYLESQTEVPGDAVIKGNVHTSFIRITDVDSEAEIGGTVFGRSRIVSRGNPKPRLTL